MENTNAQNIPYSQELLRKTIHLLSLSIPLIYIYVTKEFALQVLIPITMFFVFIDLLSKKNATFAKFFYQIFGKMLRPHEKTQKLILNGASWVLISACVFVFLYPKIIFVTSFIILIISDLSAALIGRRFGTIRFFDKSLQGATAFVLSAFLIIFVLWIAFDAPTSYLIFGLLGAVAGAIIESLSVTLKMDDNLSIPLSVGLTMIAGSYFVQELGGDFLNLLP